jgi:hypothetical protein
MRCNGNNLAVNAESGVITRSRVLQGKISGSFITCFDGTEHAECVESVMMVAKEL